MPWDNKFSFTEGETKTMTTTMSTRSPSPAPVSTQSFSDSLWSLNFSSRARSLSPLKQNFLLRCICFVSKTRKKGLCSKGTSLSTQLFLFPRFFFSFFITGSLHSFDRLAVPDYQGYPRASSTVKCKFLKKKMMMMMMVFDTNGPFESFLLPLCQNIQFYFQANPH